MKTSDKMVKLMNGVLGGYISWVLPSRNWPVDVMSPEDVNILQLNLSSFLIENGEVDIELPLQQTTTHPEEKSSSSWCCQGGPLLCVCLGLVGNSMDDSTRGIPWINLWHDERIILFSIREGGGRRWRSSTTHDLTKKLPGHAIFYEHV
jgi:hypothetical protein